MHEKRARMSVEVQSCLVFAALLLAPTTQARGSQAVTSLVQSAHVADVAGNYSESVRACADALRRSPDDLSAQACATKLQPNLKDVVSGATALLGAGDLRGALERCAAVLVLSPTDKDANACASTAHAQIAAHGRDKLTLEQARGFLATGDSGRAGQSLLDLSKSEFPDILNGALQLQDAFNRNASAQVDITQRAAIERASLLVEYGKQDDAIQLLHDVLASNASATVRDQALRALSDARPSLRRSFLESLRNPWAVQALAVLVVIAGLWIALHWARDLWRWIDGRFISGAQGRSWKFAGVAGDDPLGARDPILDALRRVPHEVRKPIWTPTRLLLYPYRGGWEVWEDFCVREDAKAKDVHEDVFDPLLDHSDGDNILNDAFQNLQFSIGPVGVGSVTKFWTGLVAWWRTGEPSFSATCQELTMPEGPKQVVIRLTSTGPAGTASVLVSTDRQSAVDAVSLSAERAAYKLLFTMSEHRDSAAQIDGHAAFRQGVTTLSRLVRAVTDEKTDKDQREKDIFKSIHNLEVARRSFEREPDHRVYHLQSLRFLGVAYALVRRDAAARIILEELEDLTDRPPARVVKQPSRPDGTWKRARAAIRSVGAGKTNSTSRLPNAPDPAVQEAARRRDQQLKVEAQFNQAMLYCRTVLEAEVIPGAAFALADALMDRVAHADATLASSVRVWKLLHRNNMFWRDWVSLTPEEIGAIRKEVESAASLPQQLDALAASAVGSDRRHFTLLGAHARRNLAVVQLRCLAAFELPARGPFAHGAGPLPEDTRERVRRAFDFLGASVLLGPLSPGGALAHAYGLLLLCRWFDAEEAARALFEADATNQFAMYIAAEAALQRGDLTVAVKYVKRAEATIVLDPALRAFVDDFTVLHNVEGFAMANAGQARQQTLWSSHEGPRRLDRYIVVHVR